MEKEKPRLGFNSAFNRIAAESIYILVNEHQTSTFTRLCFYGFRFCRYRNRITRDLLRHKNG
ncbi:hypothetical protein HMPREF9374_2044 [Desmospora sp. 8437]|nr:hypothetical protein HMPREF9374_2044 [Desmospora sp. 8437]